MRRLALAGLAWLAVTGDAVAHLALNGERAQEILRDVAAHQAAAQTGTARGPEVEALVLLGETIENLADALNQDLLAHGQVGLIGETLVRQLGTRGIGLRYSERERQYVYDLAAYREYLRRTPRGPRAADVSFRLIARAFRASVGMDPTALVGGRLPALLLAIAAEERFLRDHADHAKAGEVRFFLAVDYYRAFRNAADGSRAREYRAKAHKALEAVTRSANRFEARAAETLLEQLAPAPR